MLRACALCLFGLLVASTPVRGIQDPPAQDPPPVAASPAEAAPLPPIEEPFRAQVERRDLIQRFRPRSPLAGTWRLVRVTRRNGTDIPGASGYLSVGDRFLSFQLRFRGVGPNRDKVRVQSSFREYSLTSSQLQMSTHLGFENEPGGDIVDEPSGRIETRQYQLLGVTLRIYQVPGAFMEFERIE